MGLFDGVGNFLNTAKTNFQNNWGNMDDKEKSAFMNKLTNGFNSFTGGISSLGEQQQNPFNAELTNIDFSWALQPTQRGYYNNGY